MIDLAQTLLKLQKDPDPKACKAGETIFTEGQTPDYMYGILEGEIELFYKGIHVKTLKPGDTFGEGALITHEGRFMTAVAKTDCKLSFLNEYRFLFAIDETPTFALQVMRSLYRWLKEGAIILNQPH